MLQVMKFVSKAGTGSFFTRKMDPKQLRQWASTKGVNVKELLFRRYDPKTRKYESFSSDGKA